MILDFPVITIIIFVLSTCQFVSVYVVFNCTLNPNKHSIANLQYVSKREDFMSDYSTYKRKLMTGE